MKKSNLVMIIVSVSIFVVLVIGATYAYFQWTSGVNDRAGVNIVVENNDDNRVSSGQILIMVALALAVFNWLITPLLRMAISRKREYAADATGAFITRNPHALADALRKITSDCALNTKKVSKSMSAIFIAPPIPARAVFGDAFSTHPPVKDRIERLESMSL